MTLSEAMRKLREAVRLRHFSLKTEKAYAFWLQSYMTAVGSYPQDWTSTRKVQQFLTDEAKRGVAASTQNQALNALVFFYESVLETPLEAIEAARARRPAMVRTALSLDDTRRLLKATGDFGGYPTRLVCGLIYGCGLRVSEPLNLRLKDLDLAECRAVIRGAKGGKDRMISLPVTLMAAIEAQARMAKSVWRADAAAGRPVSMPGLMGRKSPRLALSEPWGPGSFPPTIPRSIPARTRRNAGGCTR